MPTATSRRAAPDSKLLKKRRATAEQRLQIDIDLAARYAEIAKLDTALKTFATDQGESFKEDFGAKGSISVAPAHAAEFKGEVPTIVTEKWLALSELERKRLIKSGLVSIEKQWGKASNGRVTVKVLS